MAVSTINALYATSPTTSTVAINTTHSSSSSSAAYDFDLTGRSSPSKIGGLTCLFKNSPSSSNHDLNKVVVSDDHSNTSTTSFRYSSSASLTNPISTSFNSTLLGGSRSFGRMNSTTKGLLTSAACLDGEMRSLKVKVNNTSSSLLDHVEVEDDDEELTFNMEESNVVTGNYESGSCVEELLATARRRHKIFFEDFVVKAFYVAEKAHRGQVRASGHPYLQHCVETAVLLASIGANSTVVAAGLLHDTIDDSFVTYDYIFSIFGAGVADLVHGVSKLSHLSKLARENNTADITIEADRMHTMFLAMGDARAVLIKLADRLHNMLTLEALPVDKQQRFAKETLEIFAPLANRLGISTWKEQLENLCFKHLYPIQHDELSSKLLKSFDEAMISSAIEKLEQALNDEDIFFCDLSGRHKSLYSIYCKMLKKKYTMDQIHDIHGLRLIVDGEDDCFKALNIVHQLWPEVPGKFKDYIHSPKFNGYQSLHTVVVGEGMVPLEVQIRTKEMHLQAEFGFAAHWRYKEGDSKHSSFVLQMVEWARWVVTWHCEAMNKKPSSIGFAGSLKPMCKFPTHSENCPYSYMPQCSQDGPVYVILIENDKMSVQELPANCTMMDVLERTGHGSPRYGVPLKEELRPQLNHKPVSDPTCKLKMGDVIELTPTIPDKSLIEYREEIQRMYNRGPLVSIPSSAAVAVGARTVGWRS